MVGRHSHPMQPQFTLHAPAMRDGRPLAAVAHTQARIAAGFVVAARGAAVFGPAAVPVPVPVPVLVPALVLVSVLVLVFSLAFVLVLGAGVVLLGGGDHFGGAGFFGRGLGSGW